MHRYKQLDPSALCHSAAASQSTAFLPAPRVAHGEGGARGGKVMAVPNLGHSPGRSICSSPPGHLCFTTCPPPSRDELFLFPIPSHPLPQILA